MSASSSLSTRKAQVHDAGERRPRRRRGGIAGQAVEQLALEARGQVVEQGEVRRHVIALGREVGAPELLQPAIVAVPEHGGDDQRGAAQIST
jgi:hypothetical protein